MLSRYSIKLPLYLGFPLFSVTKHFDSSVLTKPCILNSLWQPLQIKSAIAVEGLKGYIYIEAFKQTHVKQVCNPCVHVSYNIKPHSLPPTLTSSQPLCWPISLHSITA